MGDRHHFPSAASTPLYRYGVTAAAVVAAVLSRWLLDPLLGDNVPYATFFAAVALAAWVGGWRTGLLATVLGGVLALYLVVPPRYSLALPSGPHLVGLAMYFVVALAIAGFGEAMRVARRREAEQRERLRTTLVSIGDGVITTDAAGRVTSLNPVAEGMTGWATADAAGRPLDAVFNIVNETTRQPVENPAFRALKEGVIVGLANHTVLIARDGTERAIEDSAAPIRCKAGEVVGCVLVFRDVTEWRRAEVEREEAQRQVATTLESITDGFMRFDKDWRVVYVNAEAERIDRRPRSELLGRTVWELYPGTLGTRLEAEYRRAVADRVTVEFEDYYEPWGRWFAVKGFPTADGGLTVYYQDITARKLAEEEVRRQTAMLQAVTDTTADLIFVKGRDCRLTFANPACLAVLGRTAEQVVGADPQTLYADPAEGEAIRATDERIMATGTTETVEEAFTGPLGSRTYLSTKTPLRDGGGAVIGLVGISQDITARKRAEADLARERERLGLALYTGGLGVYEWRVGADEVWWSPEAYPVFGVDPAAFRPTLAAFTALVHPDDRDALWRKTQECVERREVFEHEYRVVRPDGEVRWVYNRSHVVPGPGGGAERITGVAADITDRKRAEERLRASEERYRTLIDTMDEGFVVIEVEFDEAGRATDYRHVEANPAFEKHTGLRGILGRSVRQAVPGLEEFWFDTYGRVAATGEPTRFEHQAGPLDGRWFDVYATRLGGPGSNRVAVLFTDITARRRAEDVVRASEGRLRTALTAARMVAWEWTPADGKFRVSENAAEVFGLPAGGGLTGIDQGIALLHPDDVAAYRATFRQAIDDRTGYRTLYRLVRPDDGRVVWIEERGHTVFDLPGGGVRLYGVAMDVTDRHQAEADRERLLAEVERERGRLADVFRQSPAFMCVLRGAGHVYELANDRYYQLVGQRDIIGRSVREAFPEVEGQGFLELLDGVYTTGQPVVGTGVRLRFEQAGERYVDFVYQPLRDPDGSVAGVVVVGVDVTARHQAEAELTRLHADAERERRLFDTALSNTTDFNFILTLDGRFVYANRSLLALWGRTAGEAVGRSMAELGYPPDVEARVLGNVRRVAETGREVRDETPYTSPTGEAGHYEYALAPVFDTGGAVVQVVGSARDIRDRKRVQEELAAAHQFLHSSIDALSSHIAVLDENGVILAVNDAWRRFADENQYGGHNYGVGSNYVEECEASTGECVEAGVVATGLDDVLHGRRELFELEYPCHSPTEERWFVMRVTRFRSEGPVRVVVSHEDVTKRRKAEEGLREADRRKDEFLATLAHELRNPLAPLRNGLQIMRLAGGNEKVEQARLMMDRQLTQMVRLVDDLMDVSRITRGKLDLRRERLDLRAVIDAAVETSRPLVEQAGHDLDVRVPDEPIPVDGDPTRLAQVVSNLLTNSAKYTHRGGHVRLAVERSDGTAAVRVTDDGIGIPPAMLGRVFEMFTQVDRTLEKTTGGLGIGLSLVKGLVEMHGGTIAAHSDGEGKGSEFVVRLPVVASAAPDPDPTKGEADAAVPSGRRRVLVVDDNADSADSMGQLLELLGNEVRTALDGEAGVEEAGRFRPDVILMDIGMPRLNGYDAARRIRERAWGRGMVLVALTGWGQEDDRRKTAEAGFDHHLVKPVDTAALMALLAGRSPAAPGDGRE